MLVVDTSSWISLARYYLPFDKDEILKGILIKKLEAKEIILIDEVFSECKYVAQKIVVRTMPFLKDYKTKTEEYIAEPLFHKLLVNHLCSSTYRQLPPEVKEVKKNEYLDSADCKLILFSIGNREVKPIIVTEESQLDNDVKYFQKLPKICRHSEINIPVIAMPEMINDFDEIKFLFSHLKQK